MLIHSGQQIIYFPLANTVCVLATPMFDQVWCAPSHIPPLIPPHFSSSNTGTYLVSRCGCARKRCRLSPTFRMAKLLAFVLYTDFLNRIEDGFFSFTGSGPHGLWGLLCDEGNGVEFSNNSHMYNGKIKYLQNVDGYFFLQLFSFVLICIYSRTKGFIKFLCLLEMVLVLFKLMF